MAIWRTKAYETFGFPPGTYSHAHGKVELFGELFEMAKQAIRSGDDELLSSIGQYVMWVDSQHSDELASALDLAFFLPLLRDSDLSRHVARLVPQEVIDSKRRLLLEWKRQPDSGC